MTNVLILGASGNIAKLVATQINKQVTLTQFLRTPSKLGDAVKGRVITGDVLDEDALQQVMAGQDIVYANLGPSPMAKMAKAVVKAAENAQIKRLIWVATAGIYNEIAKEGRTQAEAIYGKADDPNSYFGDERRGADIIDQSTIATTIIRPNALTNDSAVQEVVINGRNEQLQGHPISRATVANFISQLILNPDQYLNDSIAISKK